MASLNLTLLRTNTVHVTVIQNSYPFFMIHGDSDMLETCCCRNNHVRTMAHHHILLSKHFLQQCFPQCLISKGTDYSFLFYSLDPTTLKWLLMDNTQERIVLEPSSLWQCWIERKYPSGLEGSNTKHSSWNDWKSVEAI